MFGAVLAVLWLMGAEGDQPFAFLYSASSAVQTLITRVPIWAGGIVLVAVSASLSLIVDASLWTDLIGLLLSILIPILGVFLADYAEDGDIDGFGAFGGGSGSGSSSSLPPLDPDRPNFVLDNSSVTVVDAPSGLPTIIATDSAVFIDIFAGDQ